MREHREKKVKRRWMKEKREMRKCVTFEVMREKINHRKEREKILKRDNNKNDERESNNEHG